jgi:YggT family protein
VLANILIQLIDLVFLLFNLILLARILLSWVNISPYHPVARFLYSVTEPVLAPVRKMLPSSGMMDFSPLVVMLISFILEKVLVALVIALF